MQDFEVLEDFYSTPDTMLPSLMLPGKKEARMRLGLRVASHLREGNTTSEAD